MKTTYTAGVDLFLLNNEISIFTPDRQNMLYSTDKTYADIGIHLLDRNRFVKGEDLNELAKEHLNDVSKTKAISDFCERVLLASFKAGYKANKNEFTREELEKAFMAGIKSVTAHGVWYKIFNEFVSELRPLSLPNSVTIENNEIIQVKWN